MGDVAGMNEEGLQRTLGELLAANEKTQANFDEIRQQFPIQPSNVADSIPDWSELEEGGLEPPNPEEGEGESFAEQLGILGALEAFAELLWVEVSAGGAILRGGAGLTIEHPSTGIYKIWLQTATQGVFDYPGDIRECLSGTAEGSQATNANVDLIESPKGVLGFEVRLVRNVAESTLANADFVFFTASLGTEGALAGAEGPPGPTHKTLYHGEGAPPAELGEVDDFYIDTSTTTLYGPKTGEGWGAGISLVGPKGEKGEKGAAGTPGLVWKGPWSAVTTYQVGDAVEQKGSAWIAIKAGTNREPPNAEYWDLLAEGQEGGGVSELKEGEAVEWTGLSEGGGTHLSEQVKGEKSGSGLHRLRMQARASNGNVTEFQLQADDASVEKNYLAKFIIGPLTKVFMTLAEESDFPQLSSTRKVKQYGLVSALPASPNKEDECYFIADKANGIIWHLVYDGEGTYPWKKIGGPPLAISGKTASYSDTTVHGTEASVSAPLAMQFLGSYGCRSIQNQSGELTGHKVFVYVNGASKAGGEIAVTNGLFQTFPGFSPLTSALEVEAGKTIETRVQNSQAHNSTYNTGFLTVDPIRVK